MGRSYCPRSVSVLRQPDFSESEPPTHQFSSSDLISFAAMAVADVPMSGNEALILVASAVECRPVKPSDVGLSLRDYALACADLIDKRLLTPKGHVWPCGNEPCEACAR